MARLKHIKTGVIVGVTDEKAERLDSEWEVVAEPKPAPAEKPAPKPANK
jgi:hypothetical protein